ncbi:hypothetical protein Ciccas_000069 [Cichlidogyrus casuarinus]|uniref:Uncharacterized protein n=1 Tax=Cichlidogyrus casuarinus TaxID=1844966 RepID=A0ABD2QNZ3_9PLAT
MKLATFLIFFALGKALGQENVTTSKWFNAGKQSEFCTQVQSDKQISTCSIFDFSKETLADSVTVQMMTCNRMLKQLACSLRRLTCPDLPPKNFMMYNLACQSSCFAAVSMCRKSPLSPFEDGPETQYNDWAPANEFGPTYDDYESEYWPESNEMQWNRDQRSSNYPVRNNWPYSGQQQRNTQNSYGYRQPAFQSYGIRMKRNAEPERYRVRYPQYSPQHRGGVYHTFPAPNENVEQERNRRDMPPLRGSFTTPGLGTTTVRMKLNTVPEELYQACYNLPAGGCEDWAQNLTWVSRNQLVKLYSRTQVNSACPEDTSKKCKSLFPNQRFTIDDYRKGNFTVVALVKIVQTLWSFGEDGYYQPVFRFSVLDTLKSDIQTYDPKKIVSMSWPIKCSCPNNLVVGKMYLMLTHSVAATHRFTISDKTVFLSRYRIYMNQFKVGATNFQLK